MIGLFGITPYRSSGEPGLKAITGTGPSTVNNVNSYSSSSGGSKTYFEKGFSKFERSGQEVMARASQIVQ